MSDTKHHALVTGSSSGIGLAIASRLLADKYGVYGVSRRMAAQAMLDHPEYVHETIDISDLASLGSCLSEMLERVPIFSAAIFCAGYGRFGNLEEFSYEQLRDLIDTNLTAQLCFAKALMPSMKRSGRGDMIFIGSESALSGGRRGSAYVAAKSGLLGAARVLRQECAASGVRVSIINLGMARTAFYDKAGFTHGDEPENYVEPDDVAEMACSVLKLRAGTVVDEIRMTPAKSVIKRQDL